MLQLCIPVLRLVKFQQDASGYDEQTLMVQNFWLGAVRFTLNING